MKIQPTFRILFLLGGIATVAVLGFAYFLEYYFDLNPCPLCYLQRYLLWSIMILFALGALQNCLNWGRYIYSAGIMFISTLGILLASRHLWLQYFISATDITSTCMAGFETMLKFKPLLEVLKDVLTTSQECTKIDFTLLTIPLSGWSFLGFMGIICFVVVIVGLQIKRRI